jgi:hypothetical protein
MGIENLILKIQADYPQNILRNDGLDVASMDDSQLPIEDEIPTADRIVTCVNAMRGIKNPGAVKGLVEEVKRYLESLDDSVKGLCSAIAALDLIPTVGE